jgi:phosphate starvation-inducible PhoH-like protein
LKKPLNSKQITLNPFDDQRLLSLCGQYDENIHYIGKSLNVEILNNGNIFKVIGKSKNINLAVKLLEILYAETNYLPEKHLTKIKVHLHIQNIMQKTDCNIDILEPTQKINTTNGLLKLYNNQQQKYMQNMLQNDINFGVGPAGTGKTFLAVACAVFGLQQHIYKKIVLVRPVVEAGEQLGFLPGDLTQKINPYLQPLYDSLYDLLGVSKVTKHLQQQIIEIVPLAYMRGRTLNDAFIILDEGQNATIKQMKMFLTRLGFNSKIVVTGDITQIDLPSAKLSGLKHAINLLEGTNNISVTNFQSKDVVRHSLVKEIIHAYTDWENNHK